MSRRALQAKLEAMRPRLYRLAWAWCHEHDMAEELTQSAYARALASLDALRDEERLEPWMCAIIANLWKDHLRRHSIEGEQEPDELPDPTKFGGDPETDAQTHDIVREVRSAVARLRPEHRMVVTLVDLMDMSYADVARVLEIPAGTVMSRLSRARAKLKEYLEAFQTDAAPKPVARVIPFRRRA